MTAAAARDYLMQVENPKDSGTWATIGGLKGKVCTLNHEGIETTNHGSSGVKEYLDGGGIFSATASGEGVFTRDATTHAFIRNAMKVGTLVKLRFIDTGTGGETYTATWHVSSFELGGAYNEAVMFSLKAESSGDVTIS